MVGLRQALNLQRPLLMGIALVLCITVLLVFSASGGVRIESSSKFIVRTVEDIEELFPSLSSVTLERDGDRPRLRVYQTAVPSSATNLRPVLVFLHGGGWVNGSIDTYDAPMLGFTGVLESFVVVSVDYNLATVAPFPAPLLDCVAATRWVAEHIAEYGGDANRIAVGGDSAGGNLAAAVVLTLLLQATSPNAPALPPLWPPKSAASKPFKICAQWLVYPVLDAGMSTPTYATYKKGPGTLTAAKMAYFWGMYIAGKGLDAWNALAAPTLASGSAVMRASPPTLVQTAELDVLRDEGELYATALAGVGARARWLRYDGEMHAFMFRLSNPEGLNLKMPAWTEAAAFLRNECGAD